MYDYAIPSAVTSEECKKLYELAEDRVVLEMGSEFGRSTLALASSAKMVVSVDWHQGDAMTDAKDSLIDYFKNVAGFSNIVSMVGRFEDVIPLLRRSLFDGVFIDGCHERKFVERDLALAYDVLKPSGWIAFHDYGRFDVEPVVEEFASRYGVGVHFVDYLAWVNLHESV